VRNPLRKKSTSRLRWLITPRRQCLFICEKTARIFKVGRLQRGRFRDDRKREKRRHNGEGRYRFAEGDSSVSRPLARRLALTHFKKTYSCSGKGPKRRPQKKKQIIQGGEGGGGGGPKKNPSRPLPNPTSKHDHYLNQKKKKLTTNKGFIEIFFKGKEAWTSGSFIES